MEADLRYAELVRQAGAVNLDAEDFIVRHEENSDPVFQASGHIHRTTLQRFIKLGAAYKALSEAYGLDKPVALARHFDADIATATATPFTPGLPLTLEAASYALAGLLLAWGIAASCGALLLHRSPRRQGAVR
jgi:Protein of unknown function (DUF2937)